MFGIQAVIQDMTDRVVKAAKKAGFRNFGHAAASISKDMKASLVNAEGPSAPGTPPHTHRGSHLRRAVRYAATAEEAVIGPMASIVGESGGAHERGERYKGTDYPQRAFAGPALERGADRFAGSWAGSIGE